MEESAQSYSKRNLDPKIFMTSIHYLTLVRGVLAQWRIHVSRIHCNLHHYLFRSWFLLTVCLAISGVCLVFLPPSLFLLSLSVFFSFFFLSSFPQDPPTRRQILKAMPLPILALQPDPCDPGQQDRVPCVLPSGFHASILMKLDPRSLGFIYCTPKARCSHPSTLLCSHKITEWSSAWNTPHAVSPASLSRQCYWSSRVKVTQPTTNPGIRPLGSAAETCKPWLFRWKAKLL